MQDCISEGEYVKDGKTLHHSAFNLEWFGECGVIPKIIFDVGAYDFGDSIRLKERFPSAEVYTFELDEDNYAKFAPYAQSCGIHTYHIAISNASGEVPYFKSKHHQGVNAQSTLLRPTQQYKDNYGYVQHSEGHTVESITLTEFCEHNSIQHIDLCHIDVEGAEAQVLEGLNICPSLIFLEFLLGNGWCGQSYDKVYEWMIVNNYELKKSCAFDKLYQAGSVN